MKAAEVRKKFTDYFEKHGHKLLPSSPVVPADDPTILFTNAGMVQFKRVFLGQENHRPAGVRRRRRNACAPAASTTISSRSATPPGTTRSSRCSATSRSATTSSATRFAFAWEFLTEEMKLDPQHLRVSVFEEDDEARALWREITGLPDSRIYGLGAHDNFWQMADTGPCGPCSEIFVDLAHVARDLAFPAGAKGEWTEIDRKEFSTEAFVEGTEAGRFLEIWNLVFMQFDRQEDGTLVPLPKPSVDTGMGLERVSAVVQGESQQLSTPMCSRPDRGDREDRRDSLSSATTSIRRS